MAPGDIRDPWGEQLGKLPALVLPRLNQNPPKDAGAGRWGWKRGSATDPGRELAAAGPPFPS